MRDFRVGLRCLAALVLGTLCGLAEAAMPRFDLDHITVEDGLSHATVWEVFQDSRGFFWFGTQGGLDRYDGYEIRAYRHDPDDPYSLSDNDVLGLWEDRRGWLWLATRSGLERFDPESERFHKYSLDPEVSAEVVYFAYEDELGELWISGERGFFRYRVEEDTFEAVVSNFASEEEAESEDRAPGEIWTVADGPGGDSAGESAGDLWVGGERGLFRFDRSTEQFHAIDLVGDEEAESAAVYSIVKDPEGFLWVGGGLGVHRIDPETGDIVRHKKAWDGGVEKELGMVFFLVGFDEGRPSAVGPNGVHRLDRRSNLFHRVAGSALDGVAFFHVLPDDGGLWIGTDTSGIYRWDDRQQEFFHFEPDPENPRSLSGASVRDLYLDATGILWISGYNGINRYDPRGEQFEVYGVRDGLSGEGIWGLHEDRRGDLWVGTYDQGLNRLDMNDRQVTRLGEGTLGDAVTSIAEESSGALWVGSYEGLHRLDEGRFSHYVFDPDDSDLDVFSLLMDRSETLWVGAEDGLYRRQGDGATFRRFGHDPERPETSVAGGNIYSLLEDRVGFIWAGAVDRGLSRIDPDNGAVKSFFHDPAQPNSPHHLSAHGVAALLETADESLWIGTYGGGLSRLDPERKRFQHYGERDGLVDSSVLGILEGSQGRLWLSTYRGLARFDPEQEIFHNFGRSDGLPGLVFSSGSSLRSSDHKLFFGTAKGLVAFDPEDIQLDPHPPRAQVTDLKVLYESMAPDPDAPEALLPRSITATDEIVLDHRQYIFSFELAALHFADPERNRLAYRLDGFNKDWITTDASSRVAQFSNLAPGDYLFRLKAANKDGVWSRNERQIRVVILPAPWKTWWAYALYLLAAMLAVGVFIQRQRAKVENERRISRRLRQVDRMKDELLANTSHELRTPLYGMTGLAEALIDGAKGPLATPVKRDLSMIAGSGQRLTRLVDDILDFSKLREHKLELIREPVDLHSLTDIVVTLVRPLIGEKAIDLLSAVSPDLPAASADEARLQQVLYNLVGNAVKFTDAGRVKIAARVEGEHLLIEVSDTGIGIAPEHQDRVFGAFEQADASTSREFGGAGLGLAVSRRLVELHGGEMWLESTLGRGSSFFFTLPTSDREAEPLDLLHRPSRALSGIAESAATEEEATSEVPLAGGEYSILVVDDEPVIREVLINHLRAAGFHTRSAASGTDALEQLGERAVDLILLDVMMPKMSGYEVCHEIRKQYSREQLPVIFLSAKSQVEDLVSGFSEGGNDYLTKPIGKRELLARISTHLDLLYVHRQQQQDLEALRGLLPICATCKRIRGDDGKWSAIEVYIQHRSRAVFTHGICPNCTEAVLSD